MKETKQIWTVIATMLSGRSIGLLDQRIQKLEHTEGKK